jgi:HEAT repeat protein
MKRLMIILAIIFFASSQNFGQTEKRELTKTDVSNLIICMKSDNEGIRRCGVYFAGYYKVKETVIPLMTILYKDDCEEIRMLAARSLCEIGDARGLFAVKRAVKFNDSDKVKQLCFFLSNYENNIARR